MRLPTPLPRPALRRSAHRSALALILLAPLAACSLPSFMTFPPQVRGNKVDTEQLKELVPGTSTRADVVALLGSPTAKATFDDSTWIYIGEVTKPVIAGTQEVLDQQVVLVNFSDGGVVQSVQTRTSADSRPVSVVSRTTPSPGADATILQQLLGNIGRFGPGGSAGGNSSNRSGGTGNY
ncbi:outer membrane protein assembly factor BamE [Limobrevibacterium gyesilva]|uniref:Outer membrane protein assembly factor BamE n=1 Tax=Limobrevibacterium gyesilva TaxID=2991712 RepID=A0AA41YR27_9PROT|nr:outer membrane protein assembly factor BamE [Limobrevibacterium gyesilva]MCW3473952.1 outer membrane protein assembly factor BamE [Limobrevibacterium gyesilva]